MPRETERDAEVGSTRQAHPAAATRDGGIEHDPLTGPPTRLDDAPELVAEHERRAEHSVSDPAFDHPMPVGTAEPDRRDAYQQLTLERSGIRLLVQTQLPGSVQSQSLHHRTSVTFTLESLPRPAAASAAPISTGPGLAPHESTGQDPRIPVPG
jgi:hypothetical protein